MNLIWTYLKKYPKWIALDLLGAFLFVVVNLGLPTFLARMIDQGITKNDVSQLYFWAGMMGLIVLLGIVGRVTLAYAAGKLTTNIVKDIRNDLYEKIQDYSHHEYEQIGVSSLVARMTNDAFVLMQFSEMVLKLGIITPLMMIASVIMTLVTSPSLAWTVAVAMPFLVFVIFYVATKTRPLSEKQQKRLDTINQYVRENLMGLRVIRAFTREEFQEERFESVNEEYTDISKKLFNLTGLTEPLFVQIIIAMIVAIVWFALDPLKTGSLQIGDLVAFIEYSFHALFSFLLFANLFNMYPRMSVSSQRIQEVLDMPISISKNEDGITETDTRGYLEFENVTFAYPGETESPVLHNISFKAKPGETIAFIGSTGSGKSSLVNLIPRFYDVTLGRILVDGVDVRRYNLKALRSKIGFIPQKALLFTGTIAENLKYGKMDASLAELHDATDEEIVEAAKAANVDHFIRTLPGGYNMEMNQESSNISQGQKQLLTIARALLADPAILILDEATSSVDTRLELLIQKAMKRLMKGRTSFVIAHRLSTIQEADKILVLKDGQIIEQGNHESLLADKGFYYNLYQSQFSQSNTLRKSKADVVDSI